MQFYKQALGSYNKYTQDPKKKNYFDIAATLLLLIILILMIYPAIQHIAKVNKEISTGKVVDKKLTEKIDNLGFAEDSLREVKEDLPLLEKALPTGSDIKTYIKSPLEQIASKHGLSIDSVQFSDVPVSLPSKDVKLSVRDIDFSITLKGDFVKFNQFLKEAEEFIRITSIRTLSIKADGSIQTFTLQATTNYLGQPLTVTPNRVQRSQNQ